MGRATEFFDYLNCPPEELVEHNEQYGSFTPGEHTKKTRRANLKRLREEQKSIDICTEDDIFKLF